MGGEGAEGGHGAIWGAVGPSRFFGPGSPYFPLLIGFAVGAVAPVLFWLLHRRYGGMWKYVNVPVIAVFPSQVGSTRSDLITPLLVGVGVNFILKRKAPEWWRKFALVMSAGFDTGVAITVAVIFLVLTMPSHLMPWWALKRFDQEVCAPREFLEFCELANGQPNPKC
ncbi:OPT oligopeptide transporter protein-domain-containing protein [Chytridium lagenaria]|nr:OPT oligopeptide transporter protein-domain-containing protein [Chytridium lagenaria]